MPDPKERDRLPRPERQGTGIDGNGPGSPDLLHAGSNLFVDPGDGPNQGDENDEEAHHDEPQKPHSGPALGAVF